MTLVAAAVGLALLTLTIRQVGWSYVVSGVASVGWGFLVVIALGVLRIATRARAWMICVPKGGPRLRFVDAVNAMLVADARGNITPLALVVSESTEILMVRSELSTVAT